MVGNVDNQGTQSLMLAVKLFFFKYYESQAKYVSRLDSAQNFATCTLRKHLSGETILFFQMSTCTFCHVIFTHKIIH